MVVAEQRRKFRRTTKLCLAPETGNPSTYKIERTDENEEGTNDAQQENELSGSTTKNYAEYDANDDDEIEEELRDRRNNEGQQSTDENQEATDQA